MNTKHPLYKEKLRVEKEISKLHAIQRNQNWVELEKPYKSGYYMEFDLRDDIKNREDAWVFYECIKLVGQKKWWKDKTFKHKLGKGKYEYIRPGLGYISEKTYENLHPAVRKYFSEVQYWSKYWNPFRKTYSCIVPNYYFVEKIRPRWITHYKEVDSLIAQQEAELKDYLCNAKFWPINGWYGGAPKSYCKAYNRSDRRNSKQTVHKNMMNSDDYDTYEYRYRHRHSARWDYW